MAFPREARPGTPDGYHPESATESFIFTRAIDDDSSPIPVTKDALGGKGFGLVELSRLGLPVPPGVILTTRAWCEWETSNRTLTKNLVREISRQLTHIEQESGKRLGDRRHPLIVAVRSGAPISMPGAMITLLNVGLNDRTVKALGKDIGQQNAWKSYVEMMIHLGQQAYGIPRDTLHAVRMESLIRFGAERVSDLPVRELQSMVTRVKRVYRNHGLQFPQDPGEQIRAAVHGVFQSWDKPEAIEYRRQNGIPDTLGTAAIIQQIVWGLSRDNQSGAGVLLTRNIRDGEKVPSVAFASGKQGTAVVGERGTHSQYALLDLPIPDAAKRELVNIINLLGQKYLYPQDVEFTYDGKQVWVLQTRDVPLQPMAHFRVLQELMGLEKLSEHDAIRRMTTLELQSLLSPPLDPDIVRAKRKSGDILATGISISIGNASGRIISSLEEAHDFKDEPCILIMSSVSLPVITKLMDRKLYGNIVGLVAGNGGIGSHIARVGTKVGEYIPIIFGAEPQALQKNQDITIDGSTGEVFRGTIPRLQNGINKLLTGGESDLANQWYTAKLRNPWRYTTSEESINAFSDLAREAIDQSNTLYQSPKARTQHVINTLIPEEIRSPYTVVHPYDTGRMLELTREILARGNHVTIRTCFSPDQRGKAPWIMLTSETQAEEFFTNPNFPWKYGGYQTWIAHPTLTEILVGEVPQNKMNEDSIIQQEFASWTVTCTELGEIIMQVRPHTAHLRGHEEASPDDLVTYRLIKDPSNSDLLRVSGQMVGTNLTHDEVGRELAALAITRLMEWWRHYSLPKRLAAAGILYPPPHFAIPVLEGQVRVGKEQWCKVYGLKIDKVEE